jgi:hypothetical protein
MNAFLRPSFATTLAASLLVASSAAFAQSAIRTETDPWLEREIHLATSEWAPYDASDDETTDTQALGGSPRPAILLTGYWPPTNEMLRRFSPDPVKNPQGWIGSDWEGRGYDVYAFFPEFFPPDCGSCGKGFGDLTVDYQDTVLDWAAITDAIRPVGIITFSRGFNNLSWEIEMNQFNRAAWISDFCSPFGATPSPPDSSVPAGFLRQSKLPVTDIRDAVNAAQLGVTAAICFTGDGGGFLSEFIAYLGVWYQAAHADPADPARCVTAGHVHVGGRISWPTATLAAEITIREVIEQIDSLYPPETLIAFGGGAVNAACGDAETVLFVNGSSGGKTRIVELAVGSPLSVAIREATSRMGDDRASKLCVYGWIAAPAPADGVEVPGGYGRMCFGFGPFGTRLPDRIWSSLGREPLLGAHDAPNIRPPRIPDGGSVVLFSRPFGIGKPVDLTFQGLIEDDCGVGPSPFSVTNAVMARIRDTGRP